MILHYYKVNKKYVDIFLQKPLLKGFKKNIGISTTNAIERLNATYRKLNRQRNLLYIKQGMKASTSY